MAIFDNYSAVPPLFSVMTPVKTEKTEVEKRLDRVSKRLEVAKKHLTGYYDRASEAFAELAKARKDFQVAQNKYDYFVGHNDIYKRWHQRKVDELTKEQAVYRLMNDIRLGKVLPVVAETGQLADVTFD